MIFLTTISGIVLSIIAIIISVVTFIKHDKHSKNKLKPICTIHQSLYDNLISIRIENNGIGPIILKSVLFTCDNSRTANSIYYLLPEDIRKIKYHRIYIGELKGLAIHPNGKLHLMSMTPEDDIIMRKFKDTLKTITVNVEYYDIYNQNYEIQKKLNFNDDNLGILISTEGQKMLLENL
ncbi:MAG: hypothetical protein FWC03_04240 [Treponema sp.]|nr:hypothetical protein [Treponema sp.]